MVCIYHLLLLLQYEEAMRPVCLRNISEGVSPVYHAAEVHRSSLFHPFAMVELVFPLWQGGGEICTL